MASLNEALTELTNGKAEPLPNSERTSSLQIEQFHENLRLASKPIKAEELLTLLRALLPA